MSLMRIKDIFNFEKGVLQSTKCTPGKYNFITAASEWKTHNEYTHDCEALIFAAAASGSLGRTHYVNGKFVSSDLCFIITPKDSEKLPVDLKFYHLIFQAFKDEIVRNTKAGTSKEAIGLRAFGNYKLPYFNIKQQVETKEKFVKVQKSTLGIDSEFTHQLSLVTQLRQAFLREAMQGKLVEQNLADEPASELLARIKAEKEQLIKEKKIRKQKPLPQIEEEEVPFEIPKNVNFVRLGSFFSVEKGKIGIKKAVPGNVPLIVTGEERLSHNEVHFSGKAVIVPLVSSTGHGHASLKRIHYQEGEFAVGSILACIMPYLPEYFNMKFLYHYLDYYKEQLFVDKMKGAANVSLKMSSIMETPIPVLSAKVLNRYEKLIEITDQLEESIKNSQKQNEMLWGQVLREALEPDKLEVKV